MELSAGTLCGAVAGAAVLLAVVAGIADYRHRTRRDMDRVALFDWRSVQLIALMAAIVLAGLALRL